MSDAAFCAAMRPQVRASSTSGVKKSVLATSARSASNRQTAASSPVSVPTSSSGAFGGARVVRTSREQAGGELAGASGAVAELR